MTAAAEARIADANERIAEAELAAQAAASAAEEEAAAIKAAAEREAAIAELKSAIESGAAYEDVLTLIDDAPEILVENAENGVATISDLQRGFPAAARQALAQATTIEDDASAGERFTAFLRRQTNARSLAPKEGTDADAVLSRAEARLGDGDISATLAELDGLPEDGKAALSGWLDDARTRLSALEAVRTLSETTE